MGSIDVDECQVARVDGDPDFFLASPVIAAGPARGDAEIEKYFDMSVVLIPVEEALRAVGATITSMETVGALMAARSELQ